MKKAFFTICIGLILALSNNLFSQEIFTAIIQRNPQKVKELLAQDSSLVSLKNPRGYSPIHFAANFNQLEIAKLLLTYGADLKTKDRAGREPSHWAASTNSVEILKWLKQYDIGFERKDDLGNSPIYYAVTDNADKTVEFLISQNVQLTFDGSKGFDILFSSLKNDYELVIVDYFHSNFDFTQKNKIGSSLLFAACMNPNEMYLKFLLEKELDVNELNDFGDRPLFIAIKNNNLKAIETLLEYKADLNLTNALGQSSLDLAKEESNQEIVNFLLGHHAESKWSLDSFTSKYPDPKEPGMKAELFGEGYISTEDANERDVMFSPDTDEFYFSRNGGPRRMPMTVHLMNKYNNHWTLPEVASFSGKFNDAECFITYDNQKLFFISQRPEDKSKKPSSWEIWIAEREGRDWTNFHRIDTVLKGCFYPTITLDGELFYTDAKNNLMSAKIDGEQITDIKMLNENINTDQGGGYNSLVSPDGSFFIFTANGRPNNFGGGDLYISFRDPGKDWGKAINMGELINSEFTEYCPSLSRDGKYFFFTSNRKGTEDIYWIDAQIISDLKEKL